MPPKSASRPAAAPAVPVPVQPVPAWLLPAVAALTRWRSSPCSPRRSADNDTWFHLRTGAYIVQNHKLPVPDPFSWTTYLGQPAYPGEAATRDLNLKHEWGAQVILYLVYAAGGFPGDGAVPGLLSHVRSAGSWAGWSGGVPAASTCRWRPPWPRA